MSRKAKPLKINLPFDEVMRKVMLVPPMPKPRKKTAKA
jgi:hypothetical protein